MFTVTEFLKVSYRPLFSSADIDMWIATLDVADHTMCVSHRADDEDGVWGVDSIITPNGTPIFVHSAGERAGIKVSRLAEHVETHLNGLM